MIAGRVKFTFEVDLVWVFVVMLLVFILMVLVAFPPCCSANAVAATVASAPAKDYHRW